MIALLCIVVTAPQTQDSLRELELETARVKQLLEATCAPCEPCPKTTCKPCPPCRPCRSCQVLRCPPVSTGTVQERDDSTRWYAAAAMVLLGAVVGAVAISNGSEPDP